MYKYLEQVKHLLRDNYIINIGVEKKNKMEDCWSLFYIPLLNLHHRYNRCSQVSKEKYYCISLHRYQHPFLDIKNFNYYINIPKYKYKYNTLKIYL